MNLVNGKMTSKAIEAREAGRPPPGKNSPQQAPSPWPPGVPQSRIPQPSWGCRSLRKGASTQAVCPPRAVSPRWSPWPGASPPPGWPCVIGLQLAYELLEPGWQRPTGRRLPPQRLPCPRATKEALSLSYGTAIESRPADRLLPRCPAQPNAGMLSFLHPRRPAEQPACGVLVMSDGHGH